MFEREVRRFARAYPRVRGARLVILNRYATAGSPGGVRDLAQATPATNTVALVRRALRLPRAQILGLLRHELAHLADARVLDPRPGAERRADRIAERVSGRPIRYAPPHWIQTTADDGVRPRPPWLPR